MNRQDQKRRCHMTPVEYLQYEANRLKSIVVAQDEEIEEWRRKYNHQNRVLRLMSSVSPNKPLPDDFLTRALSICNEEE